MAVKIGLKLVEHNYYEEAFNIAHPLCNMTMGPFKSSAAHSIATALIAHNKETMATKIASIAATLKGKIKINTARKIALSLLDENKRSEAQHIYELLKANPLTYAQKAASELHIRLSNPTDDTRHEFEKKVDKLLENIDQHMTELEKIGIKCSKRNGKAEDPLQKIAIDSATKIGLGFVNHRLYTHAYHVAIPLCNMTLGPRKSTATLAISEALISHNQPSFASDLGCLVAPLKGQLKVKTAKEIAMMLHHHSHDTYAQQIHTLLQKNPTPYAQEAVHELNLLFEKSTPKPSEFLDTFHLKFVEAKNATPAPSKRSKPKRSNLSFFKKMTQLFETDFSQFNEIICEDKKATITKTTLRLTRKKCSLHIQSNSPPIHYNWSFDQNVIFKNDTPLPQKNYHELHKEINAIIKKIEKEEVQLHGI